MSIEGIWFLLAFGTFCVAVAIGCALASFTAFFATLGIAAIAGAVAGNLANGRDGR